ncbi:MAG: cytochrome-c peroxidase, partial [Candidatus Sericytochromatia bacterium]|nr:cytochrome-c peroxidase [Candidatus Sericytochromatia bacterium]
MAMPPLPPPGQVAPPPRPGQPVQAGQPVAPTPRVTAPPTPVATPLPAHVPPALPGQEVALGRILFFDKTLSRDGTVSCASCHDPAKGFADAVPVGVGIGGAHGTRNTPTIVNAGRQPLQFWDGRADSLEQQALGPIQAENEMGMTLPAMTARLQGTPAYAREFQTVYGSAVSSALVARAIASYEATVQAPNDDLVARVLRRDPGAL